MGYTIIPGQQQRFVEAEPNQFPIGSVIGAMLSRTERKKPETSKDDMLMALSDSGRLSKVFKQATIDQMAAAAPQEVGSAEGGVVATAPGLTAKDGQLVDSQGKVKGEYLPGYEPQPSEDIVKSLLRRKITGDEFAREAFGLPKPKERTIDEAIGDAVAGKTTFDAVRSAYPSHLDVINKAQVQLGSPTAAADIKKDPNFQEKNGWWDFTHPAVNDTTKMFIKGIQDGKLTWDNFVMHEQDFAKKYPGVNTKVVRQYFGK